MTCFAEYEEYDGVGLAKLVRNGEITATELCEEAIRRAEALNPELNAIITPLYDSAREASKRLEADAPLSGVPFLLKDAHHALKGSAMSSGSVLLSPRHLVPLGTRGTLLVHQEVLVAVQLQL
jgi:amidase